MKKTLLAAIIGISLAGCSSNDNVFSENQELSPKVEWLKSDVKTFNIPIQNIDATYKMSLAFRYTEGIEYKVLKVKVTEISPSKKESIKEYDLTVIDNKGEYVGEPGLSMFDSEHLVEANKKYSEKGTYTYKIEHAMSTDVVNLAMEIGVILDKNN
jgi:gliding motility-associated lipoprotein GldH